MRWIAVIDTETNWHDEVMSIGIVLADSAALKPADCRYFILNPEYQTGGMYSHVLELPERKYSCLCSRRQAMAYINDWLGSQDITDLFAYNARFDQTHLPELSGLIWHDIMRIAAYRQHNPSITDDMPCCTTGRLKQHYGVEPITRLLTGDNTYAETHNALFDALDELRIMNLLGLTPEKYPAARI